MKATLEIPNFEVTLTLVMTQQQATDLGRYFGNVSPYDFMQLSKGNILDAGAIVQGIYDALIPMQRKHDDDDDF